MLHPTGYRNDERRMIGRICAVLLSLLVPLALVGCGDGDSKASPTRTPTPSPTALPTQAAGAGLASEILGASVSSDRAISVTFTVADDAGIPLTAVTSSAQSEQQARVRFAVAHLEEYAGGGDLGNTFWRYVNNVNATRPAYDSGGQLVLVDARSGTYRYTYGTRLPEGYDATLTYALGIQVDRSFDGQQLGVNPIFDFVPAGGVPQVRSDTTTAQCNSCHAPLLAHGNRREVRLCTLCHTEAAVDEKGESLDFRHMVHKIHAGVDLHLVNDGPPGTAYQIFSSRSQSYVVFAEKQDDGRVTGVAFPRAIEECLTCHAEGPTAEFYASKPSAPACATCHDDVNPSLAASEAGPPGTNHQPGAYADGQCSACHAATQNQEFDISVPGAHVVPAKSAQLAGLNVTISAISSHAPGERPTITFTVSDDAGTPLRDLSTLGSLTFNYAGPTTDYVTQLGGSPLGSMPSGTLVGPDGAGAFQFTPNAALPADATGTWSLGAEARRTVQLTSQVSATEAAVNPLVTFTVDDSPPLVRRTVVDNQLCGNCHGEFSKDFSIHGGLRNQTEYCVLCHNSRQSDAARRRRDPAEVAAGALTSTIDFKVLIHKIHRGEELEQKPYLVYGFGPTPPGYSIHEFSDVLFPGDLRICSSCHVDDSELLPPYPGTALPTLRTQLDPASGQPVPADPPQTGPITAVCTACHDSDAAIAHAQTQTAPDGSEACYVCHAEGRDAAVSVVHAGRN
ncbi:MAG: OmcA/MtrC family decaheme c-type cytochrome [Deltaproteobacteria bacterium]|nr:OmcA/MtrC family decaheme c-type cytochrome [Deltaproteobacteria bacterium]